MAQVVVEMSSEEARLLRGLQKVVDQQTKMDKGNRKIETSATKAGTAIRKTGDRGRPAFGTSAVANLAKFAAGWVSVERAISTATKILQEFRQAQDQAAERARADVIAVGALAQLADTPEQFQRLSAASRRTFAEGAGQTIGDAARLVFQLESAGALEDRELFSKLAARGVVPDAALLARAAKTIQTAVGVEETGSLRDLVSKGFAASGFSPASVEQLLEAAARGGQAARQVGVSDEALLAATAIQATATGEAAFGGTQVARLVESLDKLEGEVVKGQKLTFAGKGLRQSVLDIAALDLSGPEIQKLFGRKEAINAFRGIRDNLDQFDVIMRDIALAEREDRVGRKLDLSRTDISIAAAQTAQSSQARAQIAEQATGAATNILNAVRDDLSRQFEEQGSPIRAAGVRTSIGLRRAFDSDERILELIRTRESFADARRQITPETRERIDQFFEQRDQLRAINADLVKSTQAQATAAQELRSATEAIKAAVTPPAPRPPTAAAIRQQQAMPALAE